MGQTAPKLSVLSRLREIHWAPILPTPLLIGSSLANSPRSHRNGGDAQDEPIEGLYRAQAYKRASLA